MDDDAFNDLGYDDVEDLTGYECRSPDIGQENDCELTSAVVPRRQDVAPNLKRELKLGDVYNPIDWHMRLEVDGNIAKRRKTQELENTIAQTTLRIMDIKKKRRNLVKACSGGDAATSQPPSTDCLGWPTMKLMKYPPVTGVGWFGVSSDDSLHRAYLQSRSSTRESFLDEWRGRQSRNASTRQFCALIEQVRMELDGRINPTDTQALLGGYSATDLSATTAHDSSLWVEKYNPECFFDLITEEKHNRRVLLWLRLWQEYVMHKKLNMGIFNDDETRLLETEERHGRLLPKFKILVLQGTSGIGKSVLASVVARQAGYEPFVVGITEMQGLAEFKSRMDNIAELGAISELYRAKQHRPACLVLDGIDYASVDIIRFLTQWALRDPRKVALRPVICTCNKLYTQNLKELRTNAMIMKIGGCDKIRLRKRLQQIVRAEHLDTVDDERLKSLVEICRTDVRLCLNTLQFLYAGHGVGRVTRFGIENLDVIMRNDTASDTSIFEALESIITLDYHTDRKGTVSNPSERCHRIQDLMSRRDDLDRFYQSLFHNFSEVIKLTNAQKRRSAEFFVDSDINYHTVYASQNFALLKYQSFYAVALHLCIAVHVSKRILFNLSFMTVTERSREIQEIVRTVRTNTMRSAFTFRASELVHSVLPLVYYIIQPPIKSVNVQLFSGADLAAISRVVAIMCAFRISYTLKYNNDGGFYSFEPAIEQVISYTDGRGICGFSTNIRKYIAHQGDAISPPSSTPSTPSRAIDGSTAGIRPDLYALAEWTKENREHNSKYPEMAHIPPTPLAVKRRKDQSDAFTFRYNQGSSQAVRRNIRIDALFFK